MPNGDLTSTSTFTPDPSTRNRFSIPSTLTLPATLVKSFSHIAISRTTNDNFSDGDLNSKCSVSETSFQKVHTGASHHVTIKNRSHTKMSVHRRKHSSSSENEAKITPSSVKSAEVDFREVLSKVSNGKVTNSKGEELNKSKLRSVPNFSIPWNKSPHPTPSRQGHVAKAAPVLSSLATVSTKLSRLSVVESDIKGPMTEDGHAGVSRQKDHQNEIHTSRDPKIPKIAFPDKPPPQSILPQKPPLPKSLSLDRLPSLRHMYSSDGSFRASRHFSSNRLQITDTESSPKRDELSSMFRSLDGEFQKFQSRHRALRAGVVRSVLIPFLKNYANHRSTSLLRPEDLDRRVNILNRWWVALLEMLNGRNGESISGNDRATVLEAATAIMIRPEWDAPRLSTCSHVKKSPIQSLKSRSTTSISSMGSDFLTDSVFHNIRNLYSQNLLTQIAFVIDSMSQKNVAASLVAFCGKAIAYAFFYCDGVAELLVRLWATPSKTLRRVLAVNVNASQEAMLRSASERAAERFPSCLHALIFTSSQSTMRHLRNQPQVPIAASHLPWHGPWLARWVGKDTDLFFTFMKSYHGLTCRLLPDDPSHEEIICAPGYVLVQAHILTILDATLQQTGNQPSIYQLKGPSPTTFDDILGEVDASANVLLPVSGGNRFMAENRLIMLLRDFLSGATATTTEKSQKIFAQSFENLLKAATRQTSLFDHNACFTWCDFMEEAFLIMARFHKSSPTVVSDLDWSFWLEVFKKMLESQNSMTEIRLYAFLYSLWGTLTSNNNIKRKLCLDWLLSEEIFQSKFNHWCPMVRAYYMRLICWKIGRYDDKDFEIDREILQTLSSRLNSVWCHFLYIQKASEAQGRVPPASAPCSPAPGRRLLVVRDDVPMASSGMFLSFDGFLSQPSRTQATAYERYSLLRQSSHENRYQIFGAPAEPSQSPKLGKRRWATLRNMMPFTGLGGSRSRSLPPGSDTHTGGVAPLNSTPPTRPRKGNGSGEPGSKQPQAKDSLSAKPNPDSPAVTPYYSHSFRFSLEWTEKPPNNSSLGKSGPGPERPKLPITAQAFLDSLDSDQQQPLKHEDNDDNDNPREPTGTALAVSKYSGMALAEWALVISECGDFFARRRGEGVPTYSQVETPTLKVESCRRLN